MTRLLIALAAAGILSACALPEPSANTAQTPYVEKEVITGSRLPPKGNTQGTKSEKVDAFNRDDIFRPKSTGMSGQ